MSTSTSSSKNGCSKTCIIAAGRRKVHTSYDNGNEVVEEYDVKTDELLERKYREKTTLGAKSNWKWEIGDPVSTFNPDKDLLGVNASKNPIFVRQDSKTHFVWRIRNLPYPKDVYSIDIESSPLPQFIVRTSNKKYYKRIDIPRPTVVGIPDAKLLKWSYSNNTLIIEYPKPQLILQEEYEALKEAKALKPISLS